MELKDELKAAQETLTKLEAELKGMESAHEKSNHKEHKKHGNVVNGGFDPAAQSRLQKIHDKKYAIQSQRILVEELEKKIAAAAKKADTK